MKPIPFYFLFFLLWIPLVIGAQQDLKNSKVPQPNLGSENSRRIDEASRRQVTLLENTDWKKAVSVEDFCTLYFDRAEFIFQNLNLDYPGISKVKEAVGKKNLAQACRLLLEYYKNSKSAQLLSGKKPESSSRSLAEADSVLQDVFTFQGVRGKVPRLFDGRLKWDCTGPQNDIEWAWALNRHYPVRPVLNAYLQTGDRKYGDYIDSFIKDWIISSLPYPGVRSSTAMWRGLEVSFRVKTWAQVFFILIKSDIIQPATKLLILSSLPEHAHYARNFHAQNNWLTMEISGLATVAAYWPEFKESPSWLEYGTRTISASMKEQVYPDGVQTELTSSYHHVALDNFNQYLTICREAGVQLPGYFTKTIGDMWNYLALTMRPDGYGILNNDADLNNNRKSVAKAADEFKRKDWIYLATNGEKGKKPVTGPSFVFPWAGQLISRSGYDKNAQWSFFDIGPWGSGHQHNDKLNMAITAFGRDLIVDAGRFAYKGAIADKFRRYATGSKGHNLILIDGKGQSAGPTLAKEPLPENRYKITPDFDYAWGSFDQYSGLEGKCTHTRSLFYIRGTLWVVVDRIATDKPRKIEALWHWHPDCLVEKGKNGVVFSSNPTGNLKIIPVKKDDWNVTLVKGQEQPEIQGWYSPVYNSYSPNVTSVYSTTIGSDQTFIWILLPSESRSSELNAEIVSENSEKVVLKIADPKKGIWTVTVPYENSIDANLNCTKK